MSGRLADIGVRLEAPTGLGPTARALLAEVAGLLERLIAHGEGGALDLGGVPLAPGERAALRAALGEGEVSAEIHAQGTSRVHETAVPGVWWVTHRNAAGETTVELIEVTAVPAIVASPAEEWATGLARLRARLSEGGAEVAP